MDSDALDAAHFISLRSSDILSNVVTQSSVSRGMITRATPLRTLSIRHMFPWIGAGGVTNLNQGRIMADYKRQLRTYHARQAQWAHAVEVDHRPLRAQGARRALRDRAPNEQGAAGPVF